MLSLRTNNSSLSALQALDHTGTALATSMERLGTGYRVNSARDDAAGLQLATRLASQSRGMAVAMRNTQNAVSMLQTADALLGEVGGILTRMKDLAIAAADGSATQADRDALDAEYDVLSEQVYTITNDASYGGKYLFRYIVADPGPYGPGTMGSGPMRFQIGESSDETVTEDFRPGLGRLNSSLYFAVDNGNLHGYPVDAAGTELTSDVSANALIGKMDTALDDVAVLRSQFGALANRLDSAYRNLANMQVNTQAAHGRIVDADFATETAEMTKQQMLMQAGTAMVKQSNSAAQLVMSLIQ